MTKDHIYERAFDYPEPVAFVVDDEAQVRAFVSNALTSAGFRPMQLSSSSELEQALSDSIPQLIVLDLSLGDSDAIEVLRILDGIRFPGDVLLISGHDELTLDEVHQVGMRRGLNMVEPLHKPFRLEQLRERLDAARANVPARFDAGLAAALKNDWLELWYQPKIDLRSRLMCGAEALIRLRHPTYGMVPPGSFLPSPGDPLYRPLTDFVVEKAMQDWADFAAHKMTNRLAINVPASVLQRPDFVSHLRRHLPDDPRFPGLIVEITEDEAISDPELAREVAVQLKLYNVHVSIDDFGSGYSSLARLKELPFAEVKLDRSFVNGCATDRTKRAMCEAVVDLARRFHITSVAEGVETAEDLQVLVDIGYDVAQGFLFARPMMQRGLHPPHHVTRNQPAGPAMNEMPPLTLATGLRGPLQRCTQPLSGARSGTADRSGQRCLLPGDQNRSRTDARPRPVRGVPGQSRRPDSRRGQQSRRFAAARAGNWQAGRDANAALRHPTSGVRRRRLRGAPLVASQFAGAWPRRGGALDHSSCRRRH